MIIGCLIAFFFEKIFKIKSKSSKMMIYRLLFSKTFTEYLFRGVIFALEYESV